MPESGGEVTYDTVAWCKLDVTRFSRQSRMHNFLFEVA